ncbi:hypothetical protein QCA50_002452 [Cerrena zonata]|uniref:CBM21 domain-containing protein n=1 Tax=Cerrena zonata TaxID=2478898 RepID=A0AAW0GY06_9APHY
MPYATPSNSPTATLSPSSPAPARPGHRRSRSSFSDERGPGAFAPLGALPRRKPTAKKAVFHFNVDDDSPPEHEPPPPQPTQLQGSLTPSPLASLKLAREAGRFSPSQLPPSYIDLSPLSYPSASVPFPTQSPIPSPSLQPPQNNLFGPSGSYSSSGSSSSLPRTPSTPIILSNGRPLKSSLKSSSSTPSVAGDFQHRTKHLRAQSAPSTPNVNKNVHFAGEEDGEPLTSVRVYKRTGKPASLNKPPGEETETETEAENGPSSGLSSYPFPSFGGSSAPSSSQHILHEIDPSPSVTSPVPQPHPIASSNVFLENITLPRTRPPTLRGTVLVRNVAFEKLVAVRFTLDEWTTTSEVLCKHVVSLPGLPPPFPKEKQHAQDLATRIIHGVVDEGSETSWDRFSFTIRLEDYEHRLTDRTLELVARYSVPWSEPWWDNNQGSNYRIRFRRAAASPLATPTQNTLPTPIDMPNVVSIAGSLGIGKAKNNGASSPSGRMWGADGMGLSQQRTFSAPSSLKYTPTSSLAGIPMVSTPPSPKVAPALVTPATAEAAPPLVRSHSSPYPPSTPLPSSIEGVTPSPTSPVVAEKTGNYIRRRLSLSNYVAPGSGSVSASPTTPTTPAKVEVEKPNETKKVTDNSLVTPPSTPPSQTTDLPSPTRSEKPTRIDIPSPASTATTASIPHGWPSSTSMQPDTPFSPTSTTAPEFASFGTISKSVAGLISPPRSREASEDGGSGEAGRGSPEGASTPAVQTQQNPSVKMMLPSLDLKLTSANEQEDDEDDDEEQEEEELIYPGSSSMGGMSDSTYAAFIQQWCFAQSAPPTPGVHARVGMVGGE